MLRLAKGRVSLRSRILVLILVAIALSVAVWMLVRPKTVLIGAVLPIESSLGNEENLFLRFYRDSHASLGRYRAKVLVENPASTEAEVKAAYRRLGRGRRGR